MFQNQSNPVPSWIRNQDWIPTPSWAQPRSTTVDMLPGLAVFGTGLLVGAGVALFLAPKEGRELREDVRKGAKQLGDSINEQVKVLNDKVATLTQGSDDAPALGDTLATNGVHHNA